jgi:4-amino-4-deoxy-L-arabinose transferase-like glycosyltransferase
VSRPRGLSRGVLVVVAVLLVVRNLVALDSVPLAAYVDETSIGYNAWAISHHGVDEHGAHLPLYFTAFGEYKNPVYIYVLSALLRVMPLTATSERLPAAVFGVLTCFFIALIAWRRSRSVPITALALGLAGLTPWLTVESRVGFEVISIVALTAGALWCLSIAQDGGRTGWYAAAGGLLGVAVFAYSTGRVAIGLFTIALAASELWHRRRPGRWLVATAPVAAAYVVLLVWNQVHDGALTARFSVISIGADGAPLLTVVGRFLGNWLTYFSPDFLLVSGDHNLRHSTQFGGMLLAITEPLVLAGLVAAWRSRRQPFMRFLLVGTALAPVSAALTAESVPHAVRASVMLPFLLVLAVEGIILLRSLIAPHWRPLATAVAAMAMVAQGSLFTLDMYGSWPARSAVWFDAGEIDAVTRASTMSGGGTVLLSTTLEQPYIQAAFAFQPNPPATFTPDSMTSLLGEMHMAMVDPHNLPVAPGTIVVLSAVDPAPVGAQVLFDELTPPVPAGAGSATVRYETVVVYRLP